MCLDVSGYLSGYPASYPCGCLSGLLSSQNLSPFPPLPHYVLEHVYSYTYVCMCLKLQLLMLLLYFVCLFFYDITAREVVYLFSIVQGTDYEC